MYDQILLKKLAEYFVAEEDVLPTQLLYRSGTLAIYTGGIDMLPGDKVVQYRRVRGDVAIDILNEIPPSVKYSGEEWLEKNGYNAMKLYVLLDLESQLKTAGKFSHKLDTIKGWISMIMGEAILLEDSRDDWTPPPYYFNEVASEAISALGSR